MMQSSFQARSRHDGGLGSPMMPFFGTAVGSKPRIEPLLHRVSQVRLSDDTAAGVPIG
jgi:hypothetical protein